MGGGGEADACEEELEPQLEERHGLDFLELDATYHLPLELEVTSIISARARLPIWPRMSSC